MTDRLEDILGGVEDEIRRAEERLQLGVFSVEATLASGECDLRRRSTIDREGKDQDSLEDMDSVFPAGSPAAIRRSQSRGVSDGQVATSEAPSLGESYSGRDAARGMQRRRAWGSPEHDDLPKSAKPRVVGGGRKGRRNGCSGTIHREAVVNRLLRERSARLAARSSVAPKGKPITHGGGSDKTSASTGRAAAAAHDPKTIAFSRHGRDCPEVVDVSPERQRRYGCPTSTGVRRTGGVGESLCRGGGGVSPGSTTGNIFFASDLLHPIDAENSNGGRENGESGNAAVDPRELGRVPAAGEELIETLLLRLHDDENHAHAYYEDVDIADSGLNGDGIDGNVVGQQQEENSALVERPPPPPPRPLEPNDRQLLRHQQVDITGGRGLQGRVSAHLPRPGPPERCPDVEAGERGRPRANGRDRSTSGDGNGTDRREDESDTMATARLEEQLAFRPRPRARTRSSLQQKQKEPRAGSERRIEELARSRQALYSDRERKRKELQEEAETKECTFRPNIGPSRAAGWGAEEDARFDVGGNGGGRPPLHERLHKEAREREAARALAHHHLEKEALRECTFQPTLTAAAAAVAVDANQRPLHQRVWEVEREREHKLRLLLAEKEEREGATFAPPPLGRVSEKLATRDSTSTTAGGVCGEGRAWEVGGGRRLANRLQEQAMWARERRRLRAQEHEEAEARASTFEPVISRGTKSLVRKRPDLQAPFEQRRAIMDAKRQERDRLRQAAQAEEETRWFNPPTARRTSSLLRRRMPQRLDETVEERVKRMASVEDQRKRDFVMRQRAKEKLECTFRPSLNPVTRSLGRAAPLDELVNNRRGRRVRERAKEKARNAQACSHKPVLLAEVSLMQVRTEGRVASRRDPGGGGGAGRGGGADLYGPGNRYRLSVCEPARMTAELRAREREQEERLNAIREEKEVAEMQRCTFVPQTNPAILRAQGPVLVRGLSRHLELKDVALQREHERRERESQAFGVRPGAVRRSVLGETIVEPFSLSRSDSKGWWRDRRARHEAERAAQHTFRPWTVEAERGRALSRLLDWSSALSSESSRRS